MLIQLYNPEQINIFEVRFDAADKGLNSRYLTPEFAFLADARLTSILRDVGGDELLREVYNKDLAPEGWPELIHPLDIITLLSLVSAYQLTADQTRELCAEIIHFDMASKNCEAILVRSVVIEHVSIIEGRVDQRPAEALASYHHLLTLYLMASPYNVNEVRSALGNRTVEILCSDTQPVPNGFLTPAALQRGKMIAEKRRALDPGVLLAKWLGLYEMDRLQLEDISEAQYFSILKEELEMEIKGAQQQARDPNPNPAPVTAQHWSPFDVYRDEHDDPNFDWTPYIWEKEASPMEAPIKLDCLTVDTYQVFIDEMCDDPKYLDIWGHNGRLDFKSFEATLALLRPIYVNSIDIPQIIKVLSVSQLRDLFSIASDPGLSVGFVMENYTDSTRKRMPDPKRFERKTEALFRKWSGQNHLPAAIKAQLREAPDFENLTEPEIVELFRGVFKWLDPDTMICVPGALENENHRDHSILYYLIPIAAVQSAFEEEA